ncbi:hypothetical protein [Streptomyces sp. NPDC093568]|uniref:hypothetical protein n=1 Tax=Streptomyces sp. NPDC093568 TaxID=3366041 RepID=UPI00380F4AF4
MVSRPASGQAVALDGAELEALLSAAVLRGHRPDVEGEQRAVAAFRAAREAGALRAATRRRDDWRPRERRRLALSLKTTLSLFFASLTLGGAAFAAIGSSDSSDDPAADKGRPTPSAGAPDRPGESRSTLGAGSARPGHPTTAQDTEARCRAYDQVKDGGKALDATAWQRLIEAAGGEDKVAAYCAAQLAAAKPDPTREPDKDAKGGADGEGGADGNSGVDGEGGADGTSGADGNGQGQSENGNTGNTGDAGSGSGKKN